MTFIGVLDLDLFLINVGNTVVLIQLSFLLGISLTVFCNFYILLEEVSLFLSNYVSKGGRMDSLDFE